MARQLVFALLCIVILHLPNGARAATHSVDELRAAIQRVLEDEKVPGAGIAIVASDRVIWAGGVGKSDLDSGREVTADTLFRVGSITKSFVALALVQLQERKKIDLEARLIIVAPEIEVHNPWEATHPLRIVHLLEHTAGFDDMHFNQSYNLLDAPEIPIKEVFARFTQSQWVRWPPGTRSAYANPGYGLAGYLIEKTTGRPWDDVIRDSILRPLGMTSSSFHLDEPTIARLSQGYDRRPPQAVPYRHIYLRPAGDLKSSPAEMARFVQMWLQRGRLGDAVMARPESIARMEKSVTSEAARAGFSDGYGLGNYVSAKRRIAMHGHDGGIDGFISTYRYSPEHGVGYVVLINSTASGKAFEKIEDLVFDYVTDGIPDERVTLALPEPVLRALEGAYQPTAHRLQVLGFLERLLGSVRLRVDGGVLYVHTPFRPREALVAVSARMFRLEKEGAGSVVFFREGEGPGGASQVPNVMVRRMDWFERCPWWWPTLRLWLVLSAVAVMCTAPMFALVWIPRRLLGRMRDVRHLHVRVFPLLSVLSLMIAVYALTRLGSGMEAGVRNAKTLTFCVATWSFALLGAVSAISAMGAIVLDMNRWARAHSMAVSLCCAGIAAWLASWGVIGLRMWAF